MRAKKKQGRLGGFWRAPKGGKGGTSPLQEPAKITARDSSPTFKGRKMQKEKTTQQQAR